MGSFNVACSISNLSISVGTEVYFFPLLPRKFRYPGITAFPNEKYVTYPNDYYEPFALPIQGKYNDYGSLEDIIENENTKAIEQFFDISIQAFVENIGDNYPGKEEEKEAVFRTLSGMFVHKEIYDELVSFDLKEKHLANHYLTEEVARFYDFEIVPQEQQTMLDNYHSILMRKEGLPYDLKIGQYGTTFLHQRHKEYYAFAFDKRYGQEVAQKWEKITGKKLEDVFPQEWNFNNLSDEQYQQVKEKFEELTGAPLGWSKDSEDKYDVYSLKQFAEVYETVTGETLDIDIWTAISQYDIEYNAFQKAIRQSKPEKKNYKERLAQTTDEMHRKLLQQLIEMEEQIKVDKGFGYEANQLPFGRFFKDMDYFKTLYMPTLLRGGLREAFKNYRAYYNSMYSCNRFFFPAMNGEQGGNPTASKMLLEASMHIVQKELDELEE